MCKRMDNDSSVSEPLFRSRVSSTCGIALGFRSLWLEQFVQNGRQDKAKNTSSLHEPLPTYDRGHARVALHLFVAYQAQKRAIYATILHTRRGAMPNKSNALPRCTITTSKTVAGCKTRKTKHSTTFRHLQARRRNEHVLRPQRGCFHRLDALNINVQQAHLGRKKPR